jgi:hypothetical protein
VALTSPLPEQLVGPDEAAPLPLARQDPSKCEPLALAD